MNKPSPRTITGVQPPHLHRSLTSRRMVLAMIAALVPAIAIGVLFKGLPFVATLSAAILAALVSESLVCIVRKQWTLGNLSAFYTGVAIGLILPPGCALYVPIVASVFAIIIIKAVFGGFGSNWMNPAMGGVAFVYINWAFNPKAFSELAPPIDLATPLSAALLSPGGSSLIENLTLTGYTASSMDLNLTQALNDHVLKPLGGFLHFGFFDLAIGTMAGSIASTAGLAFLVLGIFIVAAKIVPWEIPVSILGVYSALVLVLGLGGYTSSFGDLFYALLASPVIFIAIFISTDPITSPATRLGMLIYGAGIAALIFAIEKYSAFHAGEALAVVAMNCLVPLLAKIDYGLRKSREAKISQ